MGNFKVLGHRGAITAAGSFYQNSYSAFAEALKWADGFETDAVACADGTVFLVHEAKYVDHEIGVEYCAGEHLDEKSLAFLNKRRLDQLTSTEVRVLRLKDGSPLPELAETLAMVKQQQGKIINIELKGHNVLEPVLREIRTSGIPADQVLLSSFNHPSLVQLRQLAPEYHAGALFVSTTTPTAPLFPWYAGSTGAYTTFTDENLASPLLLDIQPDYMIIPDTELSSAAADMVMRHTPQAKLVAWVFTEKGGIGTEHLFDLTRQLGQTGQLAALIIDRPQEYAARLHQLATNSTA